VNSIVPETPCCLKAALAFLPTFPPPAMVGFFEELDLGKLFNNCGECKPKNSQTRPFLVNYIPGDGMKRNKEREKLPYNLRWPKQPIYPYPGHV